jgi:hypothetical protein
MHHQLFFNILKYNAVRHSELSYLVDTAPILAILDASD